MSERGSRGLGGLFCLEFEFEFEFGRRMDGAGYACKKQPVHFTLTTCLEKLSRVLGPQDVLEYGRQAASAHSH